ncbi:MAG: hypothetical protein GC179_01075 [Anaerolineaceae bacterium]|nr:hypothetical protein [Anaerolineaceae bacterium]
MKTKWGLILFLALFGVITAVYAAPAQQTVNAPNAADYKLTQVASGLSKPVYFTHSGDNTGRQFIVEQSGKIKVWQNGTVMATPFLDVGSLIATGGSEQGLLGLAFSPNFAQNGQFFINYTNTQGDTIVARYTVSANNPNVANPASATQVLFVDQPFSNHNGGNLNFGKDGLLYVGMGDGGSGGDPQNNAQNPNSLLGKMLRIDVNQANFPVQIWALGIRNPWRWSFDRLTNDFYMGDVGQDMYEEVDFWPANGGAGANYGWNIYEGFHNYKTGSIAGAIPPIAEYSHNSGCSITGGYVYRGAIMPALQGFYLYADYCNGNMWTAFRSNNTWQSVRFLTPGFSVSSFGEDQAGELYVVDYSGKVWRIDPVVAAPTNTPVTPSATPVTPSATPITPTATVAAPTETLPPTITPVEPTATLVPPTMTVEAPTPTPTTETPNGPTVKIDVIPASADVGQGILAQISLVNVSDIYGLQLTCQVNPAVLTGAGLLKGDGFNDSNSFIVDQGYQTNGSWTIAASRLAPNPTITGNIAAMTLGYTVSGAGDSTVECSALGVDINGRDLPLSVINGGFTGTGPVVTEEPTLPPTPTIEPTVEPTQTEIPTMEPTQTEVPLPTETPMPATGSISGIAVYQGSADATGITVQLLAGDGSVLNEQPVDAEGNFTFANLPAGEYAVSASGAGYLTTIFKTSAAENQVADTGTLTLKAGDIDGSQTVDLTDAGFIGANFNQPVPPAPAASDLNHDGRIDVRDLVLLGVNFGTTGPIVLP